ncbi:MAG: endopeptidase La [candidate division Zixibacteria bacterium]|nr:endopeptidase La [candidate division Zixibacteria bacterium]
MQYRHDNETIEVRSQLPLLPLRDVVVFPYMIYPLLIGRPMSISALQEAMVQDKLVFLVAQRNPTVDNPKQSDLYHIGVVARVVQVMKMPNGTLKVLVEGLLRAKIKSLDQQIGYMVARIKVIEDERESTDPETEALARRVMDLFSDYVYLNRRIPNEIVGQLAAINDNRRLADTVAANLLQKNEQKQTVLETSTVKNQLFSLIDLLSAEIEILKIEQRIDGSVRESLSRSQREYYLQQQLKAIKEELGQYDETAGDMDELHTRLEELAPPEPVRLRVEEELKKLGKMHPYSAESAVVRGYVEWILSLPWGKKTQDRTDFNEVQKILDDDHYGLEKPKKRIIEHLAVLKMAGKVRGPILCLVGPPGVGKTSLGKSVARALDRKFVRMSLGGVHDEAEIRGHRRTYIGSLPGRIIQSIKRAGSANPVFLLDEVDKIGADFRGDPAAALLEVLDPEQNFTFSDNYLELDFDLSEVLFLTTANILHDIPIPLQDRMEIIRLPGYLEFEKAHIARRFLIPKIRKELGIEKIKIELTDQALTHLIRDYTRESGVRELERKLTSVFRKIAVKEVTRKKYRSYLLKPNNIPKLIGPPAYLYADVPETAEPGYVVGLAWTETGGEILPVEVSLVPGQHKLTITGKIGEVMQESATAGLTWIRAHADQMNLDLKKIANTEIHIHIPEGAVPKEGPSAGVTMVSAMVSALTGRPVSTKLAMTGEISLTGDMLPVGGLNEKLLAAKRSGLKEIIVPYKNNKDITELPEELLEGLNIRLVKKVEEALGIVFGTGFYRATRRKSPMVAVKRKPVARRRH